MQPQIHPFEYIANAVSVNKKLLKDQYRIASVSQDGIDNRLVEMSLDLEDQIFPHSTEHGLRISVKQCNNNLFRVGIGWNRKPLQGKNLSASDVMYLLDTGDFSILSGSDSL